MPTPRTRTTLVLALGVAAATAVPVIADASNAHCRPGRGAACAHAALGGTDLRGADLRKADLRKADLRDAHLEAADLRGARLAGARLQRGHLAGARLDRADLTGAVLDGADLTRAHLRNARLTRAHIGRATRPASGYAETQAAFVCAPVDGRWCWSPQFAQADLSGANLGGAWVLGGNFQGADLTGANIAGGVFRGSDFSQADLAASTATGPVPGTGGDAMRVGAAFENTSLANASFADANLSGVTFLRTSGSAIFTGAYVQPTWWLNGANNFNGVSWPAVSCADAAIPYDAQSGAVISISESPCTTPLAGGGTASFGPQPGGFGVKLTFPTPTPSWWRGPPDLNPVPPTTITVAPGCAACSWGFWQPPGSVLAE